MMNFVAWLETTQNGNGRFDSWFFNRHRLEPSLEGSILANGLPVLISWKAVSE